MPDIQSVAQPINWEAVKCLALVVGVRESARRMGVSEEAVKKRCTREGWLNDPEAREAARRAVQERSALTTSPHLSPSALIHQELQALSAKTKVGIARGLARAAETIENMDGNEVLISSQNVKSVTQAAGLVHSWDKNAGTPKIRLELLGAKGEVAAIDVESEVVTKDEWAE